MAVLSQPGSTAVPKVGLSPEALSRGRVAVIIGITLFAALAGSILGVTGLDNAAPLLPLERAGAAGLTGLHRPRTVRGA